MPQPNTAGDDGLMKGVKFSDLQAYEAPKKSEPKQTFTLLTYELDAASLDSLSKVYRILSKWSIQYDDKTAFDANGFAVGLGMPQKGSEVARMLTDIGAKRIAQSRTTLPAGTHEVLSASPVSSQTLWFPKSHRTLGGAKLAEGKLGWIFSAEKDAADESVLTVQVEPAFWEEGLTDLRLLAGKVPYTFQTFDVGRFQMKLREGQFFVLGPSGAILTRQTLNEILFSTPQRNNGRVFVVIAQKVEGE